MTSALGHITHISNWACLKLNCWSSPNLLPPLSLSPQQIVQVDQPKKKKKTWESSSIPHAWHLIHYQVIQILSRKYISNRFISLYFHCHHLTPSSHFLSSKQLQVPLTWPLCFYSCHIQSLIYTADPSDCMMFCRYISSGVPLQVCQIILFPCLPIK